MYVDLIQSIKTALEAVSAIKAVYPYPLQDGEKPAKYPAVIFFPDASSNQFETVADNKKDYNFKLYVVVDAGQISMEDVFTDILPNAVDLVLDAFDENWSVSVSGASRSWQLIDSGSWTISKVDNGIEAVAELNLRVRMLASAV